MGVECKSAFGQWNCMSNHVRTQISLWVVVLFQPQFCGSDVLGNNQYFGLLHWSCCSGGGLRGPFCGSVNLVLGLYMHLCLAFSCCSLEFHGAGMV